MQIVSHTLPGIAHVSRAVLTTQVPVGTQAWCAAMQRNDCWSLSHTRLFAAESTSQRPGQQDQASTSGGGQGQEETNNSNGVDHMTAELQAKEKALEGLQTQVLMQTWVWS